VGGLATRIEGLAEALSSRGHETHLWFVGDPHRPGHESRGDLHLHRWCQWVSRFHPGGVYDGDHGKAAEFGHSLPPFLLRELLGPHLGASGARAVVLAEEWQTVGAVLHLHELLRQAGLRERVRVLWNANNTFGFEGIPWQRLAEVASLTTVSRYMSRRLREIGVEALVIPNGLSPDAFELPERAAVAELRGRFRDRTLLAKMARWDPDKRWLASVEIAAEMKRRRWRPLLVARGGSEPHGREVLAAARARGLVVVDRASRREGAAGLAEALRNLNGADVVNLTRFVDPPARRVLFRASDAVLANSGHEPFGLVGLETMAAGGVACTGNSGEDYAQPGKNALVLGSDDPQEFLRLFGALRERPAADRALRRAGRRTARRFAWSNVVERALLPRALP
jgi:glycosyltransferase involved in cell wall biosynthesis